MEKVKAAEGPAQEYQWIVCSDLDGTLLDHVYDWSAANKALAALRAARIPLVLNSSKTLAEMKKLAETISPGQPLVAENGGVLGIPTGDSAWTITHTGLSRQAILDHAHGLRKQRDYNFAGFADWSPEELITHTGLSLEAAERALDRHATEPILWHDTPERLETFQLQLAEQDIRILRGGRFHHLMGKADKAMGMAHIVGHIQSASTDTAVNVIALGDAENDRAMLQAADLGIVIPSKDGSFLLPEQPGIRHSPAPGPTGWNTAILQWLDGLDEK